MQSNCFPDRDSNSGPFDLEPSALTITPPCFSFWEYIWEHECKNFYNKLFDLCFSSSVEPASLELEGFWRGLRLERRNLVHDFIRKWRWSILSWCKVFIGSRSECRNESTEMTFCQRAKIRFILLYCFFYFLLYGRIPQIHQAESPRFILQGPPD